MFITNERGYPRLIVDIIKQEYNNYSKGDADFSVTELIGSPLERVLRKRHDHELEIDVDRLMFMFFGSMAHAVVEKLKADYVLDMEHRMFIKHDGVTISGRLDVVYALANKKRLDDVKFTGKGVSKDGARKSWVRQANLYRYMYNKTKNVLVDELGILAFLRNATMYEMKCCRLPIQCFELDAVERFMSKQIAFHKVIDWDVTSKVPECTPDDRWATEECWVVMPKLKAKKCLPGKFENASDAGVKLETALKKYPDAFVEHRPQVNRKCDEACDVSKYCWYAQDLKAGYVTNSYGLVDGETPERKKIDENG